MEIAGEVQKKRTRASLLALSPSFLGPFGFIVTYTEVFETFASD
jgi:hypothetical protein